MKLESQTVTPPPYTQRTLVLTVEELETFKELARAAMGSKPKLLFSIGLNTDMGQVWFNLSEGQ